MAKVVIAAVVALAVGAGGGIGYAFKREEAVRAELGASNKKLEDDLAARQKSESALRTKLQEAEARVAELEAQSKDSRSKLEKSVADLNTATKRAQDLLERAGHLEEDVSKARQDAIAQVASYQAAAQKEVDALKAEVGKAYGQVQQAAMGASNAAKQELDRLNALVQDREKVASQLQQQVTELSGVKARADQLQGEVQSWKSQAEQWKAQCEAANQRANDLEVKVDALTKEVQLLRKGGIKGILGGQ
jgi:chromosome segregation ATPase